MDLSEPTQFERCARRLGISSRLLQQAVIDTGSLNLKTLRKHLVKRGLLFSVLYFSRYVKNRLFK